MTQPTRKRSGLGRGLASLIPTGPADGNGDTGVYRNLGGQWVLA